MGRELQRVPLDFQWPLNKVWQGYLNPHYSESRECSACGGSGYSPVANKLKSQWYGYVPFNPVDKGSEPFTIDTPEVRAFAERNVSRAPEYYGPLNEHSIVREARRLAEHFNSSWSHHLDEDDVAALIEADRLWDLTHTFTPEEGWKKKEDAPRPTAREVNLWSIRGGMGHDSCNCHEVVKAAVTRMGGESTCPVCDGEGQVWSSKEAQELSEAWEREDPPKGEGYQMWETVSEGSPISPVFATAEGLAEWLVANSREIDSSTTKEQWMRFIEGPGWAPSFVGVGGQLVTGVQAV